MIDLTLARFNSMLRPLIDCNKLIKNSNMGIGEMTYSQIYVLSKTFAIQESENVPTPPKYASFGTPICNTKAFLGHSAPQESENVPIPPKYASFGTPICNEKAFPGHSAPQEIEQCPNYP